MCGIIACAGTREVRPLLLDGLSRLEYRGYDSAGLAVLTDSGDLSVQKKTGRIANLAAHVGHPTDSARLGIAHTRWATHGEPSDANAHPHLDQSGRLALVHNGVIENYDTLQQSLRSLGHTFHSATDTEVLAHLVGRHYDASTESGVHRLTSALRSALAEVKGTYGIAVMHTDLPEVIVGARRGSPLVIGLGHGETFLSSDATALAPYTQKVIYLKDFDLATIEPGRFTIDTLADGTPTWEVTELEHAPEAAERGDFPHFMLKEIHEQPQTVANALRGRLHHDEASAQLGGLNLSPAELREVERICILGCGTALYAGMTGARMLESVAFLPAEADIAGEFRFHNRPLPPRTLVFAVSQSGETADTLGAMREARRKGSRVLGICNVTGCSMARESDGGVYMHAGPEIGVAATKSFVSQLTVFALLTLTLARMRHLPAAGGHEIIRALEQLPDQISRILSQNSHIASIAARYAHAHSMLFVGRGLLVPVALEGALKMKEISYIHAAGFAASELKHGIIALVDPQTPTVCLCPHDSLHAKNLSTIQEIKARRGPVIAIATDDDPSIEKHADDVIRVPRTLEMLQPILHVIPLQLLAYHTAVALGRDVDKPRNLAKSVTVE